MKRLDILLIFLTIVILLAGIFILLYYFQAKSNACINNPFVYGAKQMEKETGYKFIGIGFLEVPFNIKQPRISFNSTSFSVE